jgi:uncharacterized protein YwqG
MMRFSGVTVPVPNGIDRNMKRAGPWVPVAPIELGGHPVNTQCDFRAPGRYDDYDRTLLRLTSDRNIMWGDRGEAVFMIRRRDLLMRDFSAVIFHRDCT